MVATTRGQMRPNHNSRSPPFVVVGLLVVIAILAFNYWSVTSTNRELSEQLSDYGSKIRRNNDELQSVAKQRDSMKRDNSFLQSQNADFKSKSIDYQSKMEQYTKEVEDLKIELENAKKSSTEAQGKEVSFKGRDP